LKISLHNAGKKFNTEWIFRNLDYTFISGESYSITGPNGSGKSTLLQVIAGSVAASEGEVFFGYNDEQKTDAEKINTLVSLAAPYLELIEEMTAKEFLHFHSIFKPLISNITIDEILQQTELENAAGKQIRFYSSGMKQRLKLAQAIFSDTPVLLLDEPCTNLDTQGYALYHSLIKKYCGQKLIIVSSNDENEYNFCNRQLNIQNYKAFL
jgi:ABC-type multidrug transport system ATPase subunit